MPSEQVEHCWQAMHERVVLPFTVLRGDAVDERVAHVIGIVDQASQQVESFGLRSAPRLLARQQLRQPVLLDEVLILSDQAHDHIGELDARIGLGV